VLLLFTYKIFCHLNWCAFSRYQFIPHSWIIDIMDISLFWELFAVQIS